MSLREQFKEEEFIEAVEIIVGNIIRELLTNDETVEKVFPDVKVTGFWFDEQIRIKIE